MAINNITLLASADPRRQGAVVHSVTNTKDYIMYYGVQSATFVRTVFPNQASGTYKMNGQIPTWRGTQIVASGITGTSRPSSPPVPYPPRNASAYYSPTQSRIVPNPGFK